MATIIGGQLFIAELPGNGIVGVALWFGPGQKFLSRFVHIIFVTFACTQMFAVTSSAMRGGTRQWISSMRCIKKNGRVMCVEFIIFWQYFS
jgi:hypothetical protein